LDGKNKKIWKRIQGAIEESLLKFSGKNITVYGAGRTDTGVHATGQVAHFDLDEK
jgi:tRNA pseudouridine38-40 synthase